MEDITRPHEPLTETTLYILLSLAPGPRHGYAIMKDVAALSGGRVQLTTGTLYGAIKRLLEQEWIARVDSTGPTDGRDRKEYRLTELGRRQLDLEVSRLQTLARVARQRILGEQL
jgi:DNA-binding PadR family transcriptional regulator